MNEKVEDISCRDATKIVKNTIRKAHCFFEQSGTFKNSFKYYGIDAEDYDIQNNFGETDNVIDFFAEIEKGYDGKPSVFDLIEKDDLIMAFFPCIYFSTIQMCYYQLTSNNNRHKDICGKIDDAIARLELRTKFHTLLYKLVHCACNRDLPLIIENPASSPSYLIGQQNFPEPTIIDKNRLTRGDYFKKPTAYWFFNCTPTHNESIQHDKKQLRIGDMKSSPKAGLCSEERSMISTGYALNFIDDFILGGGHRKGVLQQSELF